MPLLWRGPTLRITPETGAVVLTQCWVLDHPHEVTGLLFRFSSHVSVSAH